MAVTYVFGLPELSAYLGANLRLHPHIHCVVPGGGISPDGKQWISGPKGFFLPVNHYRMGSSEAIPTRCRAFPDRKNRSAPDVRQMSIGYNSHYGCHIC